MLNIAILRGRLTADPESRTHDGKPVTTFSLAVERPGPAPRTADHFSIECWNGQARACGTYLSEGRIVTVQGAFRHDAWTDGAGTRRRSYVLAHRVDFDANSEGRRDADTRRRTHDHSTA